jgi:hypothetical protein
LSTYFTLAKRAAGGIDVTGLERKAIRQVPADERFPTRIVRIKKTDPVVFIDPTLSAREPGIQLGDCSFGVGAPSAASAKPAIHGKTHASVLAQTTRRFIGVILAWTAAVAT